MITKVFSVYDQKAEAYLLPFFFKNTGEAMRAFTTAINDSGSTLGKHYADYNLFEVGEFDDSTALLRNYDPVINLGNGIEVLATPDNLHKIGEKS